MNVIDGKKLSLEIQEELLQQVNNILAQGGRRPHLAAVLVGDNPASQSYVRNKMRSCERAGYESSLIKLDQDITQEELLREVGKLNEDDAIDGFIVQLPLPAHIDEIAINLAIDPKKDVDGFHPLNFGRMAEGMPSYLPATPKGILEMLARYNIETEGKSCVVIGRSNIVGTPMSLLLSRKGNPGNATVTLVHSRTQNISKICREADIIIAAIGKPGFVKADMVKEGAVIIDVGINRLDDASRKRGYRLVGDVDYENVAPKCSHITPVPGGVGPMTVTALMMNTLLAYNKEIYH